MKTFKSNLGSLSLLISIPILGLFYEILNNSNNGVHSLVTNLDQYIPLITIFIIPYILWYGFILLTLIYSSDEPYNCLPSIH